MPRRPSNRSLVCGASFCDWYCAFVWLRDRNLASGAYWASRILALAFCTVVVFCDNSKTEAECSEQKVRNIREFFGSKRADWYAKGAVQANRCRRWLLLLDVGNEYEQNLQDVTFASSHQTARRPDRTANNQHLQESFGLPNSTILKAGLSSLASIKQCCCLLDQNPFCVAGVSNFEIAISVSAYAIKSRYLTIKINLLFSGLLLDGKHRYGLSFLGEQIVDPPLTRLAW